VGAPAPYGGGEVYDGHWRRGVPHGAGRCEYADGDVYEGGWVDGRRHGEGALAHPELFFKLGEPIPPPVSEAVVMSMARPATAPQPAGLAAWLGSEAATMPPPATARGTR